MVYLNDEILDKGIENNLISINDKRITYYAKLEKAIVIKIQKKKLEQ